ncbi:unnamed protein product [Acanthocheilonema viteae]|uniref:Uncharacterized protein n=1 Tax=Acanthocheilonema viteae TaxID=6277 RepID=A0A498ST33_ACAVI|nr:unnamed protein product [Acanthocheilonema viteae]
MHYTAGIFDDTYVGCSHVWTTYSSDTAISFDDHGCIRMEQGYWLEKEDESVIQKNFFLGIGFGNDEIKSKGIINELGKQKELSSRMIAEQLLRLADNFEAEFQNVYKTTQPHRNKNGWRVSYH